MKRLLRVLKWSFGIIFILLVLLWLAIQTAPVQNFIVDKVTSSLSNTLNTNVKIGYVKFKFFKSIQIDKIYVADQQQDTLLALDQITASIGLFSLLNQTIQLNDIEVQGLTANLYNTASDSTFNYQFIIDGLVPADTTTTSLDTTSSAPWNIGFGSASIQQTRFNYQDSVGHIYLNTFVEEIIVSFNDFDLETQKIDIQQLAITQPVINFETQVDTFVNPESTSATIVFPYTGWDLSADDLNINAANIRYWINNREVQKKVFDAEHLDIKNCQLNLSDFEWDSTALNVNLDQLKFEERSGLSLEKAQVNLSLSKEKIALSDLQIETPYSKIVNTTLLSFSDWNDLNDFLNQVKLETQFSNTSLAIEDLNYFLPYIPEEYQINKPIFLNGNLSSKNEEVRFDRLKIQLGDIFTFNSSSTLKNITNPDQLAVDFDINELQINYRALRTALPVLNLPVNADSLGIINFSGAFKGGLNSMDIKNLVLNTSTNTLFQGNGNVKNLDQIDDLTYTFQIDSLLSRAEDIAYFSTTPLPPGLYEMEDFFYKGTLSGNLQDIDSDGILKTAIGQLETDIVINFNPDYSNASYDGAIELADFDLGLFLGDTTTFGKVSFDAVIKGAGISPDSLQATIDAKVNTIGFSGYQYDSISIDGRIDQLKFIGQAGIQDENLNFDFKGMVNLNEEIPIFEFDFALDTLDLAALNLSEESIRASLTLNSNFRGNNIDDFLGQATIKDLHLSNASEHFQTDSLILKAEEIKAKDKKLVLSSNFLNASFTGDFNLTNLPSILQNYINDYFPIDQFISPVDQPDSLALEPFKQTDLPDQNMAFDIRLFDLDQLLELFVPDIKELPIVQFKGNLNTQSKDINLDLNIPSTLAAGWQIDSLRWILKGDVRVLNSTLSVPKVSDGAMTFQKIKLDNILTDKSIQTEIYLENSENNPILEWGALVKSQDQNYLLRFNDILKINNDRWDIANRHEIIFANDYLNIKDFFLEKNYQSIALKTEDTPADKDYTPIQLSFKDFELLELSSFTNLEGFEFDGLLNGNVVLNDITKNVHYFADLNINEFTVNDTLIGRFDISAQQKPNAPVIDLSVGLDGNENKMLAKGTYNIETTALNVRADIEQVPLILADPFSGGAIQESSGYINGFFDLKGTVEKPDVNGELKFNEAATQINYLKTRYRIPSSTITLNNQRIDFGKMQLFDRNNNQAILSGYIAHNFFQDIQFNLNFNTDKFRFLNTAAGDNELFYGTLLLGAQVDIKGSIDLPKININATTLAESLINVSALVEEGEARQAEYVLFAKPGVVSLDSLLSQQINSQYAAPEIDLLLNLNLTEQAKLIVIIDPSTGDQLTCKGNANLSVQVSPSGEINVNGLYTVVSGAYQFNYQGLVKRSFDLEPGSQLSFVGDPLDTRFDITAAYRTRTNIYALIGNEASLSESAEREAKERSDVKVLLNMDGDLDQPEISFDLSIEDLPASISTIVEQKLGQLREDEAELNKQIFGLLLLNSFVTEQSATAGLSTAGENIALSSVSGLISNQLNRLSERYLKGVGLTFDLESYNSQFSGESDATTRTNLNVGLTRSIFNDRVTVKVGGVVQVDNSSGANSAGLSNIAGDFVVEYQIDKSGNYVLRVFQKSDYDAFEDNNSSKTGVGINLKKSFGQ